MSVASATPGVLAKEAIARSEENKLSRRQHMLHVNNVRKKNRLELALEKVRGGTSCRTSKQKKQGALNLAAEEALLVAEINALVDSIRIYNSAMDEKVLAGKAALAEMSNTALSLTAGESAEKVALRRRVRRWENRRGGGGGGGSGGGGNDCDDGGTGKGPQANSASQNQEEEEAVAAMMAVIAEEEGSMLDER